jgi:hypothetical protein
VNKSREVKDQFLDSPVAIGLLGGLAAAGLASLFKKRREQHQLDEVDVWVESDDERFDADMLGAEATPGERLSFEDEEKQGLKQKVGHLAGDVKAKAGESMHAVKDKAVAVKQKAGVVIHDASAKAKTFATDASTKAKVFATDANRKVKNAAYDQPLLFALGAAALGIGLGMLIPITNKEREVLGPVRERTRGQIDKLGERLEETFDEVRGKVEDKLGTMSEELAGKLGGPENQNQFPETNPSTASTSSPDGLEGQDIDPLRPNPSPYKA